MLRLSPRAGHRAREMPGQRSGNCLLLEFTVVRQPELGLHEACGDRVEPFRECQRLTSPNAGGRPVRPGVAWAVWFRGRGVREESRVQVGGDGPVADPGSGCGGDGVACKAGSQDSGDEAPVLRTAVFLKCLFMYLVKALPQFRG